MQIANLVFDKGQRKLIYGLISGQTKGSVPVANYTIKVRNILLEWGIELQGSTIRQILWWGSNNQEVFRAAYMVLQKERPLHLVNLFNGTNLNTITLEQAEALIP